MNSRVTGSHEYEREFRDASSARIGMALILPKLRPM